jgi:hypothetical protein
MSELDQLLAAFDRDLATLTARLDRMEAREVAIEQTIREINEAKP